MNLTFRNLPIRVKLIVPMITALAVMLIAIYIYFPIYFKNSLVESHTREAQRIVELFSVSVSYALSHHSFEHLQTAVNNARLNNNILYIYFLEEDGKELDVYNPQDLLLQDSVMGDTSSVVRTPDAVVIKQKIPGTESETLGFLVLGYGLQSLNKKIKQVRLVTVIITFLSFLIGFVFINGVIKRITFSISKLYQQMQEIIKKTLYTGDVAVSSQDEIGRLARLFNQMMADLRLRHQRLLISQERYQNLYENAPAMFFSLDAEGRILDCNQHALQALDFDKHEIVNKYLSEFVQTVEPHELGWPAIWHQITQSGVVADVELRILPKSGPAIDVLMNTTRLRNETSEVSAGEEVGSDSELYSVAFSDITRLKQFEHEIIKNNEELAALNSVIMKVNESLELDKAVDGALLRLIEIFSATRGWVTLQENDHAKVVSFVGFRSSREARTYYQDFCGAQQISKDCAVCVNARSQNKDKIVEGIIQSPHSDEGLFRICVPLSAKGNWIGTFVLLFEDERTGQTINRSLLASVQYELGIAVMHAKLYQELKEANIKLQELDRLKSNFVSDASHHLRTPLTLIKSGIEIARKWEKNPEKNQEVLHIVAEETEYLSKIVDNLLTLARADTDNIAALQDTVDFSAICESQMKHARKIAEDKGIELHHQIQKNCYVSGDSNRLNEVVFNLLENALKFCSTGHKVGLSLACFNEEIILKVTDTGLGIPANEVDKIFDRFYRGKNSKHKIKGSGLGLAICKSVVEAHNGKITVASIPGQETVFEVQLKCLSIHSEISTQT